MANNRLVFIVPGGDTSYAINDPWRSLWMSGSLSFFVSTKGRQYIWAALFVLGARLERSISKWELQMDELKATIARLEAEVERLQEEVRGGDDAFEILACTATTYEHRLAGREATIRRLIAEVERLQAAVDKCP